LEIVIVDDGGHDDLPGTLAGLPVTLVATGGSGSAAVARNRGAEGFMDGYLIFIDADVLVDSLCLERLLAPLIAGNAEATVGNYSSDVGGYELCRTLQTAVHF
jgi:glycosyltransferase involved in cell wall biosynthesis